MTRWACAIAGVVMVVSGCECPGPNPPVNCSDTTITFETPSSGQTVDSPFEVSINVKNADGSAFSFEQAQLSVSGGAAISATSVSGNRATFTGVSGTPGAQTLVATISQGTCSKSSAAQTITVRDACSNAAVTAVSFPQDTGAPLGVLNRGELPPGTSLQIQVDATCVSGVQVRIKRGNTEVAPPTAFTNGRATISLAGIPASDSERVDLFAELVLGTTPVNTEASNPQARGSIQVTRAAPSCAVGTSGSFGPSDDADTSTPGFQMRVTGTMAIEATGTLSVNGQTAVAVVPNMSGDVSADFTLANSGSYTATITCTDANGNTNTATGTFSVDFTPPTLTIVSPTIADGGATMVVTQSPLQLQISTDAEDMAAVRVLSNGVEVTSGQISNGGATLGVPFGIDGTYTVTVTVTDLGGNATSVTFVVTVALDGCGAIFSRPGTCPALLTSTQLVGGSYAFQTTSKAVCANQPASLFRTDVFADGGVATPTLAGTTTLTAGGLANFAGIPLVSGDYRFRSEVTNVGLDAGVSVATCSVTVDLEGPAITNPIVPAGSSFATVNVSQDTQPTTPGVQRVFTFSARVPVGGRVDVCTTQAVNPVTSTTRPTSPECGSGWYVLQQGVVSPSFGLTFPDGSYEVKVVVVGGGLAVAPASAPVAVFADSVRPCVNGITRDLPQDTNNDNRLSIAELAGGAPQLVFALGCGDTSVATLSATPVVVRDVVSGVLGATRPATAVFAGGTYTVTLTGPYSTELDLDLFVELTDLGGNKNQLLANNDPASFAFRVDPVAPSCSIVSPTAALLGISQVPAGNLEVLVSTSGDVGTNGVSLNVTGQPNATLTPTLGQAQMTYALTGDSTYTLGATCTDSSGNLTTAAGRTTRVDLVAPTCNITAPANAAVSSVNDLTTTVVVTGVTDGDTLTMTSSLAGITNNLLTVAGGSATRLVRFPNGVQTVTASISDSAGNTCVAPSGGTRQIQLTVNSTSCNLDFVAGGSVITNSNGSWINRVSAANPSGASSTVVAVGALTSDCGAGRNVFLYQGPPVATPGGTPQVTNASGAVSFSGTAVTEGQEWTVSIDNGAGVMTHRSFVVSFAAPQIPSIGLQRSAASAVTVPVATNAALTFGAATGNRRVETAVATDMVFGDLDGATADAQFQLTLTGIDGARVGGLDAELEVLEGSTALMPVVVVTAAPFTPVLPRMRLGHRADDTATSLIIRVTSPAGNVTTSAHATAVDVIAPSAPTVTQSLTSARAATVSLSWMPVYDDLSDTASGGLTGGTPAAGYDVRWTTSSVPLNSSMMTASDYFGTASNADGITAWSASAISHQLTLPPINTYFIGVRARDEVGNYSVFTAPSPVSNPWVETTLTAPVASTNYGQTTSISGSLNNDAFDDLVVSASGEAGGGAVYVYFGGTTFASQVGCPAATCQRLGPSDATAGAFGVDLSVGGNVGDVSTENKPDLLVSQTWSAAAPNNGGRVVLFFGTASTTLSTADSIEIRGDSTFRIGFGSRIIRDLDGDGLDEIAIAAPVATVGGVTGRGRVYIFKGRTRAQWAALRTATDPVSMVPYIPVGSAEHVINGPNPILAAAGNGFGNSRHGFGNLGDLNGDGRPDLGVPMSRPAINRYRVLSGAAILASTSAAPLDASTGLFEVTETATTETTITNGLGAAVVTGQDIIDSSANDLVASYPSGGRVQLYSNPLASASNPAPTATIQGPLTFGFFFSAGALNSADTSADLVISQGAVVSNEAWVLYRRGTGFDTGIGTSPAFWVSRFQGAVITGSTNTALGRGNAVGDLDGQNGNDLILGDERANLVKVWR
jgi:large repetitive protein